MADFLKALEKRSPMEPNFLDGLKCLQVLEAGAKSADTGQLVVVEK